MFNYYYHNELCYFSHPPPSTIYNLPFTIHSDIDVRLKSNIKIGECQLKRMTGSGESSSSINICKTRNPKPFVHTSQNRPHTPYILNITYTIYIHSTFYIHWIYIPNEKWAENILVLSVSKKKKGTDCSNWQSEQCAHRRQWVMKSDTTKKKSGKWIAASVWI